MKKKRRITAKQNPLVSVVLPSYNHRLYVGQSIESVIAQKYRPIELLIIDDGSSDGSADVCQRYASRYEWIKFEAQPNRGVCATVNTMVSRAKGRYVAFLASDDHWVPNKLSAQIQVLEDKPQVGAVFSTADLIDENNHRLPYAATHWFSRCFQGETLVSLMLMQNVLCATTAVVRREYLDRIGPFSNLTYTQDYDYWLRLMAICDIECLPQTLTRYRIHGKNLSQTAPKLAAIETADVIKNRAGEVIARHGDQLVNLGPILRSMAQFYYMAEAWSQAAVMLETLTRSFRTTTDDEIRLAQCYMEIGHVSAAKRVVGALSDRALQLGTDRRKLVSKMESMLARY